MLGMMRGLFFSILLVVSAFTGSVLVLLPCAVCLLPLGAVDAFRACAAQVRWWWFSFAASCIEYVGGVRYEVFGDDVPRNFGGDTCVVVVCNHHCRLDWLFLWPLALRHGRCGALHIMLKDSLKHVPLFGWAMQAFGFSFLGRVDRASDVDAIKGRLGAELGAAKGGAPVYALLFPEGTDLSPSNLKKARAYGLTLDPPRRWSRVLVPKGAGLAAAIEALGDALDAVYDVTLLYETQDGKRPDEQSMCLRGVFPVAVKASVKRHARSELPRAMRVGDAAATKLWLLDKWALKEEAIANGALPQPPVKDPGPTARDAFLHFIVGAAAVYATASGLYTSARLRLLALASCALWQGLALFGGLDNVEMSIRRAAAASPRY